MLAENEWHIVTPFLLPNSFYTLNNSTQMWVNEIKGSLLPLIQPETMFISILILLEQARSEKLAFLFEILERFLFILGIYTFN
jgi:hypothetical protein